MTTLSSRVVHFVFLVEDYLNWTPPYCECVGSKIMWHERTEWEKVMNILMLNERLMNKVMKKFYNREETVFPSRYLNSMHSYPPTGKATCESKLFLFEMSIKSISKLLYMQADQPSISAPLSEHLTMLMKYLMNMMLILLHLLFRSLKGNFLKLGLQPSVLMFEKW